MTRGLIDTPPEPEGCETCKGERTVLVGEPWCFACGEEDDLSGECPCRESGTHDPVRERVLCPDCDGTGNAPERDPDEAEQDAARDGMQHGDRDGGDWL